MNEIRKCGNSYWSDILVHKTGERFRVSARYEECIASGGYRIEYSHAPKKNGSGPWYTGSLTHAYTLEHVEGHIEAWFGILSRADQVRDW